MTEKAPKPGLVLAGRYRLESKLGEGGMGTVWRAEHLVLCAPVAVKVLDRDVSRDEEAHDRFIREARSAAALRSPHVVQTLDYGIDEGFPFIAMELLEGETLATRLTRQGRLSPLETARIVTHVARAVGRAHEAGIIHRDLKPENVFIVKNEDAEVAKVLDFGVAKVEKAQLGPKGTRTRTGSLLGTPFYMSPEQAQGNKTIDPRSDLWSLGVIAFECLTGKRPFESDGLGDLVLQICVREMPKLSEAAGLPPRFDEWFEKACARDPEQRFESARELAEALRETVGAEARETLATLGDDDLPSGPRSVVVHSGQASTSGMEKTISSPRPDELPEDLAVAETGEVDGAELSQQRKPSLTVRQFGTTQSSLPQRSNRTALLGVAGAALVVGLAAGLIVLGGKGGLSSDPGPTAEPTPDAAAPVTPSGPAVTAAAPKVTPEGVAGSGATKADQDASAEALDAGAADASRDLTDGAAARPVPSESDKGEVKSPVDASTDRDWGKTNNDEPTLPAASPEAGKPTGQEPTEPKPPDNKPPLPPPPPPITPDR